MAKAVEPGARRRAGVFAAYFLLITLLAWYLSPTIAGYVMPSATFWILTAYVLLGAVALAIICCGAVRLARRLDLRIEAMEAAAPSPRPASRSRMPSEVMRSSHREPVLDSGSPDREVAALLDGLEEVTDALATGQNPTDGTRWESEADGPEDRLEVSAPEVLRLRRARDALAGSLAGPAVAAIVVVGIFAPMLPAANGTLLTSLQLNAMLGILGLGWLIGVAAYGGAAARHLGRRAA
jgi:hypothetical protein